MCFYVLFGSVLCELNSNSLHMSLSNLFFPPSKKKRPSVLLELGFVCFSLAVLTGVSYFFELKPDNSAYL